MSSNCVVVCVSNGNAGWRKRMRREHTNLDGYIEWSQNICRDERGADLVPLEHYIYDMCLVETSAGVSPLPTRRSEAET